VENDGGGDGEHSDTTRRPRAQLNMGDSRRRS
jgi:hypothetical protein